MKTTKLLTSLLLACLILAMAPAPQAQSSNAINAPLAENAFGYTIDPNYTYTWYELSQGAGTTINFDTGKDDEALAIVIPSTIFFENSYTTVYVSINGFLSFDNITQIPTNNNTSIPIDDLPNNIIAPLWDDLLLTTVDFTTGKVFYARGNDASGSYTVIEWSRVIRRGSGSDKPLTFQVILYTNGDIIFSYADLQDTIDNATIGIEDDKGVDGVLYRFNTNGSSIAPGDSIAFHPPGPGARVKAFPKYFGKFLSNQTIDLPVTVRNTGTSPDTFNLSTTPEESSAWGIDFYNAKTMKLLEDTDGDSIVDTGELVPGKAGEQQILLRIFDKSAITPGEHLFLEVKATSSADPSKYFVVIRDAAVPAQFAHAINNPGTGASVLFSLPDNQVLEQSTRQTNLSTIPALVKVSRFIYLQAWEEESNIKYIVLNYLSRFVSSPPSIVHNNIVIGLDTQSDSLPVLASTPDERIGMLYIRRIKDVRNATVNENVMFNLLNIDGDIIKEVNITNNQKSDKVQAVDTDFFNYPALTATSGGKFFLAWERTRWIMLNDIDRKAIVDIYIAVLDSNGNVIVPPTCLTGSIDDDKHYHEPVFTATQDGGAYLVFSVFDIVSQSYELGDVKFNNSLQEEYRGLLLDWSGTKPDAAQLANGNIIMAWSNLTENKIYFSVIHTDSAPFGYETPIAINSPTGLTPDFVSVTQDPFGNGIITWGDRQKDLLFYTLVSSTGATITPPMMFNRGIIPNQYEDFNGNMASAPLEGTKKNFIPLIGW